MTVNPIPATPTISAGSATTFCTGGSVVLTSSSASGNQWYRNGTLIDGATNQTYSATTSGDYTVIVTTLGCSSPTSAPTSVTVNPIPATPTITAGSTTTFCTGGSVTLTSSAASGNQWYLGGNPIGGATNQTYSATATGNYTVVVTASGCSSVASAPTSVTVNPIPATPTITAGSITTFCTGGSVTLTSSAASGNQWYLGGNPIGGATNQTYSATATGNYTLIVTTLGCPSPASAPTSVTVNPIPATPTITAGSTTTFCASGSMTLTSSSTTGNQWYRNGTLIDGATNQTYSATTSGDYTLIVITLSCPSLASAPTSVTVNPLPTATITGTATVCKDATAPDITFNGSGGTAPYTFTYTINNGGNLTAATTNGNSVTRAQSAAAGGTFVYTLVSVSDANNCAQSQTGSATVTVLAPSTPTSPIGATISQGQSTTLTASGCTGEGFTLLWYQSADNSPVTMPVSPQVTTNYYARCQQTLGQTSCLSGKTADVIVMVGQKIFVNVANTNPTQDGNSWATAFTSLQAGLTAARTSGYSPLEIWVAQGTYKPGTLRRDVFEIPSGIQVYGGFVGTETELSQRNWNTHKTTLSGEIGTSSLSDNVNHLVIFSQTSGDTRLDGFTIERGYAEFFNPAQNTEPIEPAPASSGGGILVINKSQGLITHCIITNNRAIAGGGILLQDSSKVSITKTVIWGNEATFGGGIYVLGGSTPRLENLLIVTNKALGGGVYINRSQPSLLHCTIASNQGTNGTAGGIFNTNSAAIVRNSILWGNSSPQTTPGISITYSIVQGGQAGTGNTDQNPLFVNASPSGLAPLGGLGNYHLQSCSPAINTGDNTDAPAEDLEGNLRPYAAAVDRGAYENQSLGSNGPATLTLTENITSGNVLKTAGKITATNQISNAQVTYQASQSVTLLPGFTTTGNSFQAIIGGCEPNLIPNTVSEQK